VQFRQGRAEQGRALHAAVLDSGFLRGGPSLRDIFTGEMHHCIEAFAG
jgi:hypothetical protein